MSNDINELHPTVKRACIELKDRLRRQGHDMGVSSTYRSIEEQNAIYAQGRTTTGNIITQVRGGDSYHNYRLAFDIFNNVKGNMYPKEFMQLAGKIGMELGLEWGGSWKGFVDTPHFQLTNGLTTRQLKTKAIVPQNTVLPWEVIEQQIILQYNGNTHTMNSILFNEFNYLTMDNLKAIVDKPVSADKPVNNVDNLIYKGKTYYKLRDYFDNKVAYNEKTRVITIDNN